MTAAIVIERRALDIVLGLSRFDGTLDHTETALMVMRYALIASFLSLGFAAWAGNHTNEPEPGGETEPAASAEVDLDAAAEIFQKSCRACHGNRAQGAASYPALADLEPDYIAEMLERYRAGERIGPNSILMIQNAKKLSDQDIANLSVYIATAFD